MQPNTGCGTEQPGRSSAGRHGNSIRSAGSTTCTCSPASSRPELGESGRPHADPPDDALVARPRRRRLPDGRHRHDLQGHGPAAPSRTAPSVTAHRISNAPRIREFLREMHREVFAGRPEHVLIVGEMPGGDRRPGARVHRPGSARTRHGLPIRACRAGSRSRREVGHPAACAGRRQGRPEPVAGRTDRARLEQLGTITTSREPSRDSGTTGVTGSSRSSYSAPCCTCTGVRRTSIRARTWA